MNVKITSDSTCDLSPELLRQYDVSITPLSVCCGERVGADGTEITPDDIYEYVHAEGKLPQTSAVNCVDYMKEFHRRSNDHLPLRAKYIGHLVCEKRLMCPELSCVDVTIDGLAYRIQTEATCLVLGAAAGDNHPPQYFTGGYL